MSISDMIVAHPHVEGHLNQALAVAIAACFDCLQHCTSCADACAGEKNADQMSQCIRLCLDCADVCEVTGKLAIRRIGTHESLIEAMLETCARACATCAEHCESQAARMELCRICAGSCRAFERACRNAVGQSEVIVATAFASRFQPRLERLSGRPLDRGWPDET